MRPTRSLIALAVALGVASPAALRAQDSASVAVERPTSDYITREQMSDKNFSNLYDLVEAVHNNWLRERIPSPADRTKVGVDTSGKAQYTNDYNPAGRSFPGTNGGIQVYIDGTRAGGLDQLKSLHPAELYSARRINGIDAQARFGIGHSAGVIYVLTLSSKDRTP